MPNAIKTFLLKRHTRQQRNNQRKVPNFATLWSFLFRFLVIQPKLRNYSTIQNLLRIWNEWSLAPETLAFSEIWPLIWLFWPYCEDHLWLLWTNRVRSSTATWWAEATQGTLTWTATFPTSMGSCTITRRPMDATTTCPCRTTGNSRSVSAAGRLWTSPPPYVCKVCVCAGGGGGRRGRRMSTFLTLVRVCAQCLNGGLNNEPL